MNTPTCKHCRTEAVGVLSTVLGDITVFGCGTRSRSGEPRTAACYEAEIAWHSKRVDACLDGLRDALTEAGDEETVPTDVLVQLTMKIVNTRRSTFV